jgi:hypothetical protein
MFFRFVPLFLFFSYQKNHPDSIWCNSGSGSSETHGAKRTPQVRLGLAQERMEFENQFPEIWTVRGRWFDELKEFRIGFLVQTVRLQSMVIFLVVADGLQSEIPDR